MDETTLARQGMKLGNLLVLSAGELTDEQKRHRIDLLATILLSLAAVLSAISAYQASRWYSEMNVSLAESSTLRSADAIDDRNVNRQMLADMMLFVEWADAFRKTDTTLMTAIQDRFSEPLKKAFPAWLRLEKKGAANLLPQGTSFDLKEYAPALQQESNQLIIQSENKFATARNSAEVGDSYIFSLVIFSLALFFGAVCIKVDAHLFQAILFWIGAFIITMGIITVLQLPWNSGF
jgi:hypothetical protein